MDDDDVYDSNHPGDREVERRLSAYADLRLSPSVATTTRMRAAVMTAAHRRAALMEADSTPRVAPAATAGIRWRRPVVALLAAALTLGILAGSVLAARPGGPLYEARLWAEMANLPMEVVARATAEVARLEARLEEARQAAGAGDGSAFEAALNAYSSILTEATAGSHGDATALATIEVSLTRHIIVLTGLADRVPAPAQSAIQHALASSSKVLEDIDHQPPNGNDGSGGGAGGPGNPAGGPTDKPGKPSPDEHGGPAGTEKPGKPDKSPANPDQPEPSRRP